MLDRRVFPLDINISYMITCLPHPEKYHYMYNSMVVYSNGAYMHLSYLIYG